jgi:hypothetical protein
VRSPSAASTAVLSAPAHGSPARPGRHSHTVPAGSRRGNVACALPGAGDRAGRDADSAGRGADVAGWVQAAASAALTTTNATAGRAHQNGTIFTDGIVFHRISCQDGSADDLRVRDQPDVRRDATHLSAGREKPAELGCHRGGLVSEGFDVRTGGEQ